jgi:hypothetical protein
MGTIPYEDISLIRRECPHLVPDPVAWLFEKLGELADWDTDAEGPDGSAKARPIPDLATITVMPDADKLAPLAHPQRVIGSSVPRSSPSVAALETSPR